MSKTDPIERALDRLGELRHAEVPSAVAAEIRGFLHNRSNLVVAKSAKVARELRLAEMIPDLLRTFNKFMANPKRLDKRCAAITEIIGALYELDYDEPAPYLAGLKHVQMEASFGPPVDEAAKLRGLSAQGLLRTHYSDALMEVVPLLVDREPPSRIGAIRALAVNGGEAGVLLLRLKVLTGDAEPEALGECFAGLLTASPDKSIPFVARYIDSEESATGEVATLALGESRLPAAFEILKEKWARTIGTSERKVLLVSMVASRLEEAIAFLLAVVETENVATAADTIEALAIYRLNERVSNAVQGAVSRRGEKRLLKRFTRDFASPA
jgi:hypothetical protein